jgi:multiple sugar transport system permease protein
MPRSMARLFMVVLGQIALLAGAILIMTPVLYMVSASFMTNDEIFSTRFQILPSNLNWGNYIEVFARFNFMRYLSNSVFVTGAIVFFEPALLADDRI